MFGTNPIRPPEKGDGQYLQVQEIFPTLQGEGPHTGVPSVFIRLGGCNLACDFCDTEFESFETLSLEEILHEVGFLHDEDEARRLIVITGGEPLRQNIAPLCEALLEQSYAVQIETNGTLWRADIPAAVDIICSPKAGKLGYGVLRADIIARLRALKYIISKRREPYTHFPRSTQGIETWLQPMDEGDATLNQENLEYVLTLAEKHGCKVSLQTHKLFALD